MIKEIIKDENILSQKSERFVFGQDDELINDLIDTANANKNNCLGLACVQIGVPKKIIVVRKGDNFIPFINPIIVKKSTQTYKSKERCLSLDGEREVTRHKSIRVIYATRSGKSKCADFNGFIAQIIQHEIDHLNGILI